MPVQTNHLLETQPDGTFKFSPAGLLKEGPFLEVFVSIPQALAQFYTQENIAIPSPISGMALIDTGASKSCVHGQIMRELKVSPISTATTHTAAGAVIHSLYPAHFTFPAPKIEIDFTSVVGVDLSGQTIMGKQLIALIGRDVLAMGLLVYNGSTGSYSLAI